MTRDRHPARRVAAGLTALCLALALALLASSPAVAAAALPAKTQAPPTGVTYLGDAGRFAEPQGTDLFGGFKNVVPGDTLTQIIRLQNLQTDGRTVALYLRATAPDEAGRAFLADLRLTVRQGATILSQAPADETAGLTNDVLLGRFDADHSGDITVELTVPETLDNTIAGAAGAVNWIFTATVTPAPLPTATAPPGPTGTPGPTASAPPGTPAPTASAPPGTPGPTATSTPPPAGGAGEDGPATPAVPLANKTPPHIPATGDPGIPPPCFAVAAAIAALAIPALAKRIRKH